MEKLSFLSNTFARNCIGLLFYTLLALPGIHAQVYTGNVTFSTQAEIDAWPATYIQVDGSVTVQGGDIVDLSPLSNLVVISGYLTISETQLVNINGFDNLESVEWLIIQLNNNLVSVDGFNALTTLTGDPLLGSGRIQMNLNAGLTTISGFNTIANIPYSLELYGNNLSGGVSGFTNLQSVGGNLFIGSDNSISELSGFPVLSSVANVIIVDNSQLTSVTNFGLLTAIGTASVQNNTQLSDCCFIQDWLDDGVLTGSLTVEDNATGCETQQDIADHCVDGDNDGYTLADGDCNDNNPNINPGATEICDNVDNNCDGNVDEGLDTYVGDVVLASQADVNSFSSCITTIQGQLYVDGIDITDLTPLAALISVSSKVTVNSPLLTSLNGLHNLTNAGGLQIETTSLADLSGLSGLVTVNGALRILNCDGLTSLDGLSALTVVNAAFRVWDCDAITNLNGLSGLHQTGPMDIKGNPNLVNIDGIQNITTAFSLSVYDNLNLSDCCVIQDLEEAGLLINFYINNNNTGCDSPAEIEVNCSDVDNDGFTPADGDCDDNNPDINPDAIEICDGVDNNCDGNIDEGFTVINGNVSLGSQAAVDAFSPCVTTITGNLFISGASITNLTALANLSSVGGQVVLFLNSSLTDITGLSGLTSIGTRLVLDRNPLISSLSAFAAISTVTEIYLAQNNSLADLSGLENITSAGAINISNHAGLLNLDGLAGITSVTGNVLIGANPVLSDCCGIHDLLNTPGAIGGSISIYLNDTGCDSPVQINAYCSDNDNDGVTPADGDCDDSDPAINPNAIEICDGLDNNCNGLTDDEDPNVIGQATWYADADSDGAGDPNSSVMSCTQPEGYVANANDLCPDDGNKIEPGICGCGAVDLDRDSDGICDTEDDCLAMPEIGGFNYTDCHCPEGFYAVTEEVNGQFVITGCQLCPAGYYCPDGILAYPCPIGEYSPVTGAIVCQVCAACTETETEGSSFCSPETDPPTAICQDITVELNANGEAAITPEMIDNGSEDACGIAQISLSQTSFDCSNLGPNVVTLTVEDNNGNLNSCTATVTVEDNSAPAFASCPSDIGEGLCGDVVFWDEPVATDNCPDITVMQTEGPANGSIFPVGTTTVSYLVSDASGNTTGCSFNVTVDPLTIQTGPQLIAYFGYPNSVDLSASASGGTGPYDYNWSPGADLNDPTLASPTYTPSYFGTMIFTVTVTDANGCSGTGTQTVVVEDVRCTNANQQVKIMLCHDGETICVNENAVEAHLGHGDYLGPCQQAFQATHDRSEATNLDGSVHRFADGETGYQGTDVTLTPNPFTEHLDILVRLASPIQPVSVRIFDIHGKFVDMLFDGELPAGDHLYHWEGKNTHGNALASGIYLIVVQTDKEITTRQAVLMH